MSLPPIVIIEGPDFCGKSTLAAHIASLGHVYIHNSYTSRRSARLGYERNAGKPRVLDRSWLSEKVYGPVLRPEQPCNWIEDYLMVEVDKPTYIFCMRPFEACYEQQAAEEKEHRYPKRAFKKIWKAYEQEFMEMKLKSPSRVYLFDSDKWINDITGFIQQF